MHNFCTRAAIAGIFLAALFVCLPLQAQSDAPSMVASVDFEASKSLRHVATLEPSQDPAHRLQTLIRESMPRPEPGGPDRAAEMLAVECADRAFALTRAMFHLQNPGLAARKGELHPPLLFGHLRAPFGAVRFGKTNTKFRHTGWTLSASRGHRVRGIAEGKVVFAGPFRGYGTMVVIEHGRGYHSVYAHLKTALVEEGESLNMGDPLGVVGKTGSLHGEKLYFELRHFGRPIDPAGWFAPASRYR